MIPLLYYENYVRNDAEEIIKKIYDWKNPGAHYFDDLYQSLIFYVLRVKFNIDFRKFNYSALIRSKQMTRSEALERIKEVYVIEDKKIIDLCIKRLGLSKSKKTHKILNNINLSKTARKVNIQNIKRNIPKGILKKIEKLYK